MNRSRTGARILLPLIPSLAIRRFQYGVLIRCDQTRAVTVGTLLRLLLEVALALYLFWLPGWDGLVIATTALTAGVVFEAAYATVRVRPAVRDSLPDVLPNARPLTAHRFLRFYIPLVLTTFMQILLQPLVSASLSRMPDSLGSLALWPVLYGVLIMTNSAAIAYVEAVIVLLDRPGSIEELQRFTWRLGLTLATIPLALAVTPAGDYLFGQIAALPAELLQQARLALWLMIPLPALTTLSSWYQGVLISGQRTRSITEAVSLSVTTVTVLLTLGSIWGGQPCVGATGTGPPALRCAGGLPGYDCIRRRVNRTQHLAVAAHPAHLPVDPPAACPGIGVGDWKDGYFGPSFRQNVKCAAPSTVRNSTRQPQERLLNEELVLR